MEPPQNGSAHFGSGFNSDQFNSFTALLELPPNQAVQLLLHSPDSVSPADNSPESSSFKRVKQEQLDSDSSPTPSHANKRKNRDKKAKNSKKKARKSRVEEDDDVPYVHVRACRGQATNTHSLAERARREKINARMKLLQDMVPGCNKISGTASVLDEIINHVQFLQRQVQFLSMKLAGADPRICFNLDNFMAAEDGSLVGSNVLGMVLPTVCNEQIRPQYQQRWHLDDFQQPVLVKEDDSSNLIQTENAASHPSQLKMEL